jgi:hypothetical protein
VACIDSGEVIDGNIHWDCIFCNTQTGVPEAGVPSFAGLVVPVGLMESKLLRDFCPWHPQIAALLP